MGVSPDPNALRRDRPGDAPWITLTPRADDAETPDWPLTDPTPRELDLWHREWRRPQADQWLAHDDTQAVALFVRLLARAELPDSPVTLQKYVREWRHELGISASGASLRRWRLPNAKPAEVTSLRVVQPGMTGATKNGVSIPSARSRFRSTYVPPAERPAADVDPDDAPAPF
jgi:hypothetical protein